MTLDQNFERTMLFELSRIDRGPINACEISSRSEEMRHEVLATPARKLSPALIPNVGVRVAAMHTHSHTTWRRRSSRAHNKK